jgi:glutamate racemase
MNADGPLGIFDSGVGGLSVWRELVRALPNEDTIYFADQAHVPYSARSRAELGRYSLAITRFLLAHECKAIVVACNTASAVALKLLRETFPEVVIVGMEPAVKPAVALTRSGVVGILATPATFEGRLFQETARRHAAGIRLIAQACAGLAERIEAGQLDDEATRQALRAHLAPILAANADVIVLGCTHYPFVRETIQAQAGPACRILDPAPAVARHVGQCLRAQQLQTQRTRPGHATFYTSGAPAKFALALQRLVGVPDAPREVRWRPDDTIVDMSGAPYGQTMRGGT